MVGMVSSCGACKFLRRKCEDVCIFAPYFSYDRAEVHFAAVHKVFGASNVSKLLSHLPTCQRAAAATTVTYEAQARLRDPVRGCVSYILALQQQVASLQEAIDCLAGNNLGNDYTTYQSAGCLSPQPAMGSLDKFHLGEQQYCMVDDAHSSAFGNVETQPVYKEAIAQLEQCLFNEEPSLWEELSMSSLNQDLLC